MIFTYIDDDGNILYFNQFGQFVGIDRNVIQYQEEKYDFDNIIIPEPIDYDYNDVSFDFEQPLALQSQFTHSQKCRFCQKLTHLSPVHAVAKSANATFFGEIQSH